MATEERRIRSIRLRPSPKSYEAMDEVALDEPTCIFVNGEYYVTLIATPEMRRELAVGHLLSEGVIETVDDISEVTLRGGDVVVELKGEVDLREVSVGMMNLIVTACGTRPRGGREKLPIQRVGSSLRVKAERITGMLSELNRRSSVHMRTRGTHAAMLCDKDGEVRAFAEDVGRHNAVDKVIGRLALEGGDLGECVLLSTGRQSGEMVQKAARGGVPVVASMTVPLASGIRLAEATGVTLISVDRGELKVYSEPQRIEL